MVRKCSWFLTALSLGFFLVLGCEKKPVQPPRPVETNTLPAASTSQNADTNKQVFAVKGVIREVMPDFTEAKIKHEEIPGYMPAMIMTFAVKDTNELIGLKSNDVVSFQMVVTENDAWIERVQKLSEPPPTELPTRKSTRVVRDVEPLNVGDLVPEYHFTNQLGEKVSMSQFKGKAVAITFIFTTCPFPTFCPLMSKNFAETQKKLKAMPNALTNWHLLEISFDPEKDTPEVMKAYAQNYDYDPKHWSFVTGDLIDITAMTEQFGVMFYREGGLLNHNLRTAVIDTNGRLQAILPHNKWTSDELVAEIVKAAAVGDQK